MTWVLDGEKSPERVEIETSKQWQELVSDQTDYAVWIGHATYLINNGDINILTDPIFSKRPFLISKSSSEIWPSFTTLQFFIVIELLKMVYSLMLLIYA